MIVAADDWCEICPICEGDMSDCVNCDGSGLVPHECENDEERDDHVPAFLDREHVLNRHQLVALGLDHEDLASSSF